MSAALATMSFPLLLACNTDLVDSDTGGETIDTGSVGVVPVPPKGPYGEHSFDVPASANWVNTGVYLRAGESLEYTASGFWSLYGRVFVSGGDRSLGELGLCAFGALGVRSGLDSDERISCLGSKGVFTAEKEGIVYMGMVVGSDGAESYGMARLSADGALQVTVTSEADTVPTVSAEAASAYPFDRVRSGWVEIQSEHHRITLPAVVAQTDAQVAKNGMARMDQAYVSQRELRGSAPFRGERIRWYPFDAVWPWSANPIRIDPSMVTGNEMSRILTSANSAQFFTNISRPLGDSFSGMDGFYGYKTTNTAPWDRIFSIRALDDLDAYYWDPCTEKESYLASLDYEVFVYDPYLKVCFMQEFEARYGDDFYDRLFRGMENQPTLYSWVDSEEVLWGYVKGRMDVTAGQDTSELFELWGVPYE